MSLLTLVGEAARVLSASHGPNSPLGITHSQTSPVHLLISSAFHSFGKSLLYPPLCPWYHPAFHTQLSFNSQPSVPPYVCFPLRKLSPAFCRLFEVAQDSCLEMDLSLLCFCFSCLDFKRSVSQKGLDMSLGPPYHSAFYSSQDSGHLFYSVNHLQGCQSSTEHEDNLDTQKVFPSNSFYFCTESSDVD